VIDPEDAERELWKKGSGLPGKNEGLDDVIEASMEDLVEAFGGEDGA
jgi:hypothetical protein